MKCKIICSVHSKNAREWEVTPDGRVWPCCYFANGWDSRKDTSNPLDHQLLKSDKKLQKLMQDDPDWNNLETHRLSDIIEHEIYQNHIFFPGWESDEPSPVCVHECGTFIDPVTGEETNNANLYIAPRGEFDGHD